jgi:hypothetical protein
MSKHIPWFLNVIAPAHDLSVEDVTMPASNLTILSRTLLKATIKNYGIGTEHGFNVVCNASDSEHIIYSDTVAIDSIKHFGMKIIRFRPFDATKTGKISFKIFIEHFFEKDYNNYNNQIESTNDVIHLVDNFESNTYNWQFDGGWGVTNSYEAHSGKNSIHVNGGATPYVNDMNTTMTYMPGFSVHELPGLLLKYWARFLTEKNKDICYIEGSIDNNTWIKLDSLTGISPKWQQYQVDLTPLLSLHDQIVWFRFHFISDGQTNQFGILIDDIEIYPIYTTDIKRTPLSQQPTEWGLAQNFPNPFNSSTIITYQVPITLKVRIEIFDILGHQVKLVSDRTHTPGHYTLQWNGQDENNVIVPNGVYFYRITADGYKAVRKMILLK